MQIKIPAKYPLVWLEQALTSSSKRQVSDQYKAIQSARKLHFTALRTDKATVDYSQWNVPRIKLDSYLTALHAANNELYREEGAHSRSRAQRSATINDLENCIRRNFTHIVEWEKLPNQKDLEEVLSQNDSEKVKQLFEKILHSWALKSILQIRREQNGTEIGTGYPVKFARLLGTVMKSDSESAKKRILYEDGRTKIYALNNENTEIAVYSKISNQYLQLEIKDSKLTNLVFGIYGKNEELLNSISFDLSLPRKEISIKAKSAKQEIQKPAIPVTEKLSSKLAKMDYRANKELQLPVILS